LTREFRPHGIDAVAVGAVTGAADGGLGLAGGGITRAKGDGGGET